jgi:hypothetical protein
MININNDLWILYNKCEDDFWNFKPKIKSNLISWKICNNNNKNKIMNHFNKKLKNIK